MVQRSEMRRSGVLSFPDNQCLWLRLKDTWPCVIKTILADTDLAQMALENNWRDDGDANQQEHLPLADADSRLQSGCHIFSHCEMPQLVNSLPIEVCVCSIWRPDMCIEFPHIPGQNMWLSMYLLRIASTIQIFMQICSLITEYPLVSTLSAEW